MNCTHPSKFPPLINITRSGYSNSIISSDLSLHFDYGSHGLITAVLIDPFSSIMSMLTNTKKHEPNAMGFYYTHNHKKIITLYNNHDGTPVSWMGPNITFDTLLNSIYVYKIKCYPLISHHDNLRDLIFNIKTPQPNYHKLLTQIPFNEHHHMECNIVVKILKQLDPNIVINNTNISSRIFKRHISMKSTRKNKSEDILNSSRQCLESMLMVFMDLFITKHQFQNTILNIKSNRLAKEHDLITNIVCSIEHGVISVATINELITNLEKIDHHQFPKIHHPKPNIDVTEDHLLCTFNQDNKTSDNLQKLSELGRYISTLPYDHTLISLYNDVVKQTNVSPISLNPTSIKLKTNKSTIILDIHNPDLSSLSISELKDILIYIDSLRSSNGISDNRYGPLQNAILHALSKK